MAQLKKQYQDAVCQRLQLNKQVHMYIAGSMSVTEQVHMCMYTHTQSHTCTKTTAYI